MAIGDDFTVDYSTGNIRHTANTNTYTVLELHRWLMDLADDEEASSTSSDFLDITSPTPSERSTDNIVTLINGFNIDDDASEYFYDGSITQDGGDTVYSGLVVVGSLAGTTTLKVIQNNTFYDSQASPYWGTGLNTDAAQNILLRILVKTRVNGVDIDEKKVRVQARTYGDTYAEFSATLGLGNSVAAIFTNLDLNNATASGTVGTWTVTNTEGYQLIDIDDDSTDEDYYAEWDRGATAGGSGDVNDIYEWAKYITEAGTAQTIHGMNGELFRGITHNLSYDLETGGITLATNDTLAWGTLIDTATSGSVGDFTVGEAVHEDTATPAWKGEVIAWDGTADYLVIRLTSGSITVTDTFTGQSSAATGTVDATTAAVSSEGGRAVVLAVDDAGATGDVWVQLIAGTVPGDNDLLRDASVLDDYVTQAGAATSRTLTPCFLGTSTGSNLIAAYGISVTTPDDTSVGDQYFPLDDTGPILPPNNQTFEVTGLVDGGAGLEDRVLVGPKDTGDDFNFNQFKLDGAITQASTTITIGGAGGDEATIPSDTPNAGTIRVLDDNGIYQRVAYTGKTSTTFTGCSGDGTWNAADLNNVFLSYIDDIYDESGGATDNTLDYTATYSSSRSLWIRVRNGNSTSPIVPFEVGGTFGSGGGSVAAIRTDDA